MDRNKVLETSLVLVTGFLVIYLISEKALMLYFALFFGVTGIFIKPLAKLIAVGWFKLAEFLNYFVSKIILGLLFFVVLWPVSVLYKSSNKDKLRLKPTKKSLWIDRNRKYSMNDFEKIW